jgi:phage protein D
MAFDTVIMVDGEAADDLIAASTVEVCERIGEPTTFRIEYGLTPTDNDFPLLTDGRLSAGSEITIGVKVKDTNDVLCKGQVFGQRVHFERGVRDSNVSILGGDKTMEMDRTIVTKVWTGVKVSDAISSILSTYVDDVQVDPIDTKHDTKSHELVQCETDLRFVRRLATRYGCWFWVATDKDDKTTAYFRRPALDATPIATLGMAKDKEAFDELEVEWDVERPSTAQGDQYVLRTKALVSGTVERSPLTPLGGLAFADVAMRRDVRVGAPVDDAGDFKARSEAALIEGSWFVRARGITNATAAGIPLHAHAIVQLEGIGSRHSGKYVVAAVRHVLDVDGHSMHVELIRNAWEA